MIVKIVHKPNFPPRAMPITTIATSSIIRTTFTCQPFLSASENVNASYEPRPKDAAA